jgi:hypothetical protein
MARLALVRISDNVVVSPPVSEGGWVTLPGVGQMSPAVAGWEGGGEISYSTDPETGAQIATEGAAQFLLAPVVDFVEPAGKRAVGNATYTYSGGEVIEAYEVEDIPAPPPATVANLTIDELKLALGLS